MQSINDKRKKEKLKNLGEDEYYLLVDLLETYSTIFKSLREHGQRAIASYAQNHMNKK